jgi:hypothetical protein
MNGALSRQAAVPSTEPRRRPAAQATRDGDERAREEKLALEPETKAAEEVVKKLFEDQAAFFAKIAAEKPKPNQ